MKKHFSCWGLAFLVMLGSSIIYSNDTKIRVDFTGRQDIL